MGEQVHVNHVGCEAGIDKKKRLYIKRTEKGLVAYCHHCNDKGFAGDLTGRLSTWFHTEETSVTKNTIPELCEMTMDGKLWLAKYYCDDTFRVFNGVKGQPKKLSLDLLDAEGSLIGYQLRNLIPDAIPKYSTHFFEQNNRGDSSWFHNGSKILVITEDYLSAFRISQDTKVSSVALLRTTISDTTLIQIAELNFEHIWIWLDPDRAGVEGATKAEHKLRHYLPQETSIHKIAMDREPKQCTPLQLIAIVPTT